jgi:hypothetical protein
MQLEVLVHTSPKQLLYLRKLSIYFSANLILLNLANIRSAESAASGARVAPEAERS